MTEPTLNVGALSDQEATLALALLAERLGMSVSPKKHAADWAQAVADGRALENSDGCVILRLHHPIETDDATLEKVSRVTVRIIKVRDMRKAVRPNGETGLTELANEIITPRVFDDLERMDDCDLFLGAVHHQLGKFLGSSPKASDTEVSSGSSAPSAATSASPRLI